MSRTNWKFGYAVLCLIAVFAFDVAYFNGCRCWFGEWERMQGKVALGILGLIGARFIGAWLFKEKNEGWKAYLVFAVLSPFVVTVAFTVASLFLPPELRSHSE